MNKINEFLVSGATYGITAGGIYVNWETLKSNILFMVGFILVLCQIIYWIQKILGFRK
jgi:hypothetical protein